MWHDLCPIRVGRHMENPLKNVTAQNPAAKNKDSSWTLGGRPSPACGPSVLLSFRGFCIIREEIRRVWMRYVACTHFYSTVPSKVCLSANQGITQLIFMSLAHAPPTFQFYPALMMQLVFRK